VWNDMSASRNIIRNEPFTRGECNGFNGRLIFNPLPQLGQNLIHTPTDLVLRVTWSHFWGETMEELRASIIEAILLVRVYQGRGRTKAWADNRSNCLTK
jgi:hypothetical protein